MRESEDTGWADSSRGETVKGGLGVYYTSGPAGICGFRRSPDSPWACDDSHRCATIQSSRSDNGLMLQNEGLSCQLQG